MKNLLQNLSWRDLTDIAVVWLFMYNALLLIRGTRAVQILSGVVVLLVLQGAAYSLKLQAIYFLVRGLVLAIVVALPIVFQPELRRALMQLGARSMIVPFNHVSRDVLVKVIDEISWAASMLKMSRTGALIAIERETGLEEFIEQGVPVNGEVSAKLLLSIFTPRTPLHDNAVIIRGDKVVAASCVLPLSENALSYRDHAYGTRHRAALGLSEQTDAVVVVVSEETGGISVARDGKLMRNLDEEQLRKQLLAYCAPTAAPPTAWPFRDMVRRWLRLRPVSTTQRLGGAPKLNVEPPEPAVVRPSVAPAPVEEPLTAPETTRLAVDELPPALHEHIPEEAAELQRRQEEIVHKRAEEAQRRKEQARKAEEEARRAEEESKKAESDEESTKPTDAGPAGGRPR